MEAEFKLQREYQKSAVYVEHSQSRAELNFHSPIECWLVIKGSIECWINGKRYILHQGELVIAFSYDTHGYRFLEAETVVGTLILPPAFCGAIQEELNKTRAVEPVIRDPEIFEKVRNAFLEMNRSENITGRGYLYVALGTILDHLPLEDRQEKVNPQLSVRLMEYLQKNFREDLSLKSVAATLGYHPDYISRYFKECFHLSFGRYVTMLRLRECILLMKAGKSLADCAFESGFGSLSTFHRVFQEEFQCTPKTYMKRLQE